MELTAPPSRAQIQRLEDELLALPQVEIPTAHDFAPGLYVRTITIPKGATLTGKVHATEHVFIISKGDMTLVTEQGRMRVQAPFQCIGKAGMKRVGYAHEETVCTNIHITPEKDLARLEAELIVPDALPAPERVKEIL
jgi:hypothetical protein